MDVPRAEAPGPARTAVQVTVERSGPCQAHVRFTVPSAEFQTAVRRALSEAGRNVKMKGFRPGHVPPQVIERQFGQQIRRDAAEHFARQAFEQAVKEHSLQVVGFQRLDLEKLPVLEGSDFSEQFEVSLRPVIELGLYKGLAVTSELEPVMDPEIDAAIENVRAQQAKPEPAGDEGLPKDGVALAQVEWLSAAGEVVLSREGLRLSPQSPTPGVDAAAFEAVLTGAKDGETREVAMVFPEEFERAELRGQPGTTRVAVSQAYRLIPPTDAELRQLFAAEDEAALKKTVKEKMEEAKAERENQRVEGALLEQLLATHEFELPPRMLEEQTKARLAQVRQQLESQGTPAERLDEQVESQRESAAQAAARGLRALFLVQTIAEAEKLLVTREDMERELKAIAQRNQATLEEVNEYYKKNNLFDQMAIEILERKVRAFLRENARIEEPS
jgi:trigger factor